MPRYDRLFERRRADGVVIPFLMAGDPSIGATMAAVEALVAAGADALELGIPFSDPVADGPVIQRAAVRALEAGATPARCMELVAAVRASYPNLPIGLLVYANLVARRGIAEFYRAVSAAGADSVLIPDVPGVEVRPFAHAARAAGVDPVFIIPPAASDDVIARAAAFGGGYTYVQGRPGVTGAATPMARPDASLIRRIDAAGAPPSVVGFGVSTRRHLEDALAAGARGVIAGSAVVAIVERSAGDQPRMRAELRAFMEGLRPPSAGASAPSPALTVSAMHPAITR